MQLVKELTGGKVVVGWAPAGPGFFDAMLKSRQVHVAYVLHGRRMVVTVPYQEYVEMLADTDECPALFGLWESRNDWLFLYRGRLFVVSDAVLETYRGTDNRVTNDGWLAIWDLIRSLFDRQTANIHQSVDRARNSAASASRIGISDEVKIFVWNRDDGRCVRCGSNRELEYDHVIPLALGGSNTARNLQLLCAPCNQAKAAEIA